VVSALPKSDLLLLSYPRLEHESNGESALSMVPTTPYPAQAHSHVKAHLVSHTQLDEPGWTPWIGGTWRKWVRGTILGYRDFLGREATVRTPPGLSLLRSLTP